MKLISSVIVNTAPEKRKAMTRDAHERCEEPDESLVLFEIGDMDSDDEDDSLRAAEECKRAAVAACKFIDVHDDDDSPLAAEECKKAAVAACRIIDMNNNGSGQAKPVSQMQDPCYELNGDYEPTAHQPEYQAIIATGEDDDVTARPRRMMGFAAYHGPKFIPAEIKDNYEHWRSQTVTAAPRLAVAPPANLFGNMYS